MDDETFVADFGCDGYTLGMVGECEQNIKSGAGLPKCHGIEAAIEHGIDVHQLAANVKRSVSERLRRHQIALDIVEKLRKAKRL